MQRYFDHGIMQTETQGNRISIAFRRGEYKRQETDSGEEHASLVMGPVKNTYLAMNWRVWRKAMRWRV